MRKLIVALLVSLLSLNALSGVVLADGMIFPELDALLVVQSHHVTVDIACDANGVAHAVTRVEQVFANPYDVPVTGRYLFPVPPDAMLSGFRATFDGQAQNVTRQDAATTNRQLYDLVVQNGDPSLLQYADWETFAFDVSLPARSAREMTLSYEEVLAPAGGMLHYRYILSTERYTAQPLDDVSVTVNLASDGGLGTLYSSSHAVTTERLDAGHAQVTWTAQNVQPYENFDLYFSLADGGFGGGLLTGVSEDAEGVAQEHFLFLFAPEKAEQDAALPKDIVFVIDRSGSMSGGKLEQAQGALRFILDRLNARDRFSIVAFDNQLLSFSPVLREADAQALLEARRFVDTLYPNTNTDIEGALQNSLGILETSESRPGVPRLVVFLTDGLPTAGVTDAASIADLVGHSNDRVEARLHVFGVGYDVNSHLLDRLSAENGGSVTYVQPDENLELVLSTFYGKIADPVLTGLEITFDGLEVYDLYPRMLPDMFQGSSLLLSGRYRPTGDTATITVRGVAGSEVQTYRYTYDVRAVPQHDFVPRLWATRRIGDLLDKVRVEGESAVLVEEIRELGLAYGLVTPYTTFVIAAQAGGAASESNMALYSNQSDLNRASGQVTIQARVQNQAYQDASQAGLASGANVINNGQRSMVQVQGRATAQNVDLRLLQGRDDLDEGLSDEWIARNIKVDRKVAFGSEAYFALAADPEARESLQSGRNVLFEYQGEVIQVSDDASAQETAPQTSDARTSEGRADSGRDFGFVGAVVQGLVSLAQAAWEAITR